MNAGFGDDFIFRVMDFWWVVVVVVVIGIRVVVVVVEFFVECLNEGVCVVTCLSP